MQWSNFYILVVRKIGKTLPGLVSLDSCCDIQVVQSEFGVTNMKAAGVMVWEIFFMPHFEAR